MHDSGRNLRLQNLCSDTTCNASNPHKVRIVTINFFFKQTDRISPKIGLYHTPEVHNQAYINEYNYFTRLVYNNIDLTDGQLT